MNKELECEVCRFVEPAPVEVEWRFRLNEFLIQGVKEHAVLALVWCLKKLAWRARESFFFSAPRDLFRDYPEKAGSRPDNEIDLLCVIDGKLHICEVKSSSRDINPKSLQKFGDVVENLRPNVATLAVMEERNDTLEAAIAGLRSRLEVVGVICQLLTLERGDLDESSYLP